MSRPPLEIVLSRVPSSDPLLQTHSPGTVGSHHGRPTADLVLALLDRDARVRTVFSNISVGGLTQCGIDKLEDLFTIVHKVCKRTSAVLFASQKISGIPMTSLVTGLSAALPQLSIILLGRAAVPDLVLEAVEAGARGYLIKPVRGHHLKWAIKRMARGLPAISPRAEAALLLALRHRSAVVRAPLTRRQNEILTMLFLDRSDKEISKALGISVATVHAHLAALYKRAGVHNRRQVVHLFSLQSTPAGPWEDAFGT